MRQRTGGDLLNSTIFTDAILGSAGFQPAIRGILPRTGEGVFAENNIEFPLRMSEEPSGRMPDEAGNMPALPRKRHRASFLLSRVVIAFIWAFVAASAFGQTDPQFAKANQEYAQGYFKEAVASYETLVRSGPLSANLFYDLGNAYFRTGDFGRAILNYERALGLERHHPEAAANLQIARDEARALEMQQSRPERYLQFASVNQYGIAAAVAFWVGAFCIVALIFARRRSARLIALSILSFSVCALAILAIYEIDRGSKGRTLAVVTGDDMQARLATADTANSVLALPPGSEINILSTRGDWIYAALPNNLRGWIPANGTELVRL
jgi:tetratricopeptide (TPR) repeat protein